VTVGPPARTVELDNPASRLRLARAIQGLSIRIAKALNRFCRRRVDSVFADRGEVGGGRGGAGRLVGAPLMSRDQGAIHTRVP